MSLTNCRFYENKYPDLEEFVMVNVRFPRIRPFTFLFIMLRSSIGQTSKHPRCSTNVDFTTAMTHAPHHLDRRNGRLRQAPRIRQHRRHDPPFRTLTAAYPIHTKAYPSRAQRGRRGATSRQREGYVHPASTQLSLPLLLTK